MKFSEKKNKLIWDLSYKLGELDSETKQGLVRELLRQVSTKKIKEIENAFFEKEGK